ncbi:Oidioi.mRNA.OKI2018_I69.XSR.g14210.t1.cds [Oikopleura dioica]|uniref:Oidioi.mRNA.OKI2018_I69.XSR.g14210.t1.cds n=1 Tax=Oikopleura dioica TaxID=34765 RepID=A0ABN7S9N5_OIKDI|nr:Oidioi.mRNA.OKI2018_I69.XSR.g14210.t1.cds [Oikopleura dioica]
MPGLKFEFGVINLPNPNAVHPWIFGVPRISTEKSPRDITAFFFADSISLKTANFIKIEEKAPNRVVFDVAANCPLIDDPEHHTAILGFIYSCQDQFRIQNGEPIAPWRDIPCRLNIFEQAKVTDQWCQSMFSWLSPKCNKCGFHCQAHNLGKKIEFVTAVESADGRRKGYVQVLNA